jgi:hypothetical protein
MAASSRHYGDIVNWIEKIIESCETPQQEMAARKLVRQFEILYRDIDQQLNWDLSRKLRSALDNKVYSRMEKKIE